MKEKQFYQCPICGNIIEVIEGDINHITCCGKKMDLMVANSKDAAVEKHVPVYEKKDNEIVVKVGSVEHPMSEEHYIMWIALVANNTTIRIDLTPGVVPEVKFPYIAGSVIYAYCNLHGLWKADVE